MKRMTSAVALIAASILGLTACGSSSDPLSSSTPAGSSSASGGAGQPREYRLGEDPGTCTRSNPW